MSVNIKEGVVEFRVGVDLNDMEHFCSWCGSASGGPFCRKKGMMAEQQALNVLRGRCDLARIVVENKNGDKVDVLGTLTKEGFWVRGGKNSDIECQAFPRLGKVVATKRRGVRDVLRGRCDLARIVVENGYGDKAEVLGTFVGNDFLIRRDDENPVTDCREPYLLDESA